ncbi:GNAT family N-acetyltransferase [Geomonas sp.]|uniref:GNAT family N-acetyltransferase n=1 Tax=Geomonas sp. TaxID=2651584 RepID=UPI002B4989D9|nr:GNAT family N-acetyltransferase [Geomonas sp.]HJV33442.1 GNAT family N-acetyltransferase [Geomonas sp.]
MIGAVKMRYYQFREQWQSSGFLSAVKFAVYRCEEAVPVEKRLDLLKPLQPPPDADELELVELSRENPPTAHYPLQSRREKAFVNLAKGYRAFALVRNGTVIADLWYVTSERPAGSGIERYLQWFDIQLGRDEAYMFDMHVFPDARGKALATFFLASVLHAMRESGFGKVYGYFDAHNFPALWVHRLLGYQERPRVLVRKLFVHESARSIPERAASSG